MPKIPLYNRGQGLTTRMATGALSPRANVGAFTAPGQAQARLASQAGQIAFDFGMAQKNAETRREQDEYFTQFSREFAEYNRNDKQTDTKKYRDDFKKFSDRKLNTIDARTDLTNSQKNKIKQSLSSTILSYSNSGENKAFNRGQIIRTERAVGSISEKINQASLFPKGHADRVRLLTEIETDLSGYNLDGLRTGYSIQSIKKGFEALDFGKQIDAATSASQLDEIALEVPKSTLNASTQQKIKNRIKTRKSEIRAKSYDDNVGVVNSLSVNFEDKEPLEDAILNGEVQSFTTDEGQTVVVDTSELSNTQRSNLVRSYVNPLFKDLFDVTQQNAVDEITTSEDALSAAMNLMNPKSIDADGTTVEDREAAIIEAAEQTAEKTIRDIQTGNFNPETAMDSFKTVKELLEREISPNGSLLKMIGKKGDKASNILDKIANAEKAMNKANASNARVSALTEAGKTGDLQEAFRMMPDAKSGEFDQVIDDAMQRLDGDPQRQMDYLSRNGVINKGFQSKLKVGRSRLQVAGKTTLDDSDREAISIYRNLSLRQDLLTDHIQGEDLTWWRSFEVLSNAYGDEDALTLMQRQIPDTDLKVSEKFLDEQIAVTDEEITEVAWWPFDKTSPQNTGYMRGEIKKLAMEYIKYGVNQEQALTTAGKQFAASHMFIGNAITPIMPEFNKKTGVLKNIDRIASVVIDDFAKANEQLLEDNEISADDLSLLPFPGTADNFQIVIDGGRPIRGQDGQYVTKSQKELLEVDISEGKLKAINQKIKSSFLGETVEKELSEDIDYQAQVARKLM